MRTIWDRLTPEEQAAAEKRCSTLTLERLKTITHPGVLYVYDWFELHVLFGNDLSFPVNKELWKKLRNHE